MIRQAVAGDLSQVQAIVQAAYAPYIAVIGTEPGPMGDDYEDRMARDQVWVLDNGNGVDAVLVLEAQADAFLLDNIAVHPDRQGLGYGRILLDFAEAEAVRRGWNAVTLYTHVLMTANIAIYRARGYVERERRREKGFDRVYMVKPLR